MYEYASDLRWGSVAIGSCFRFGGESLGVYPRATSPDPALRQMCRDRNELDRNRYSEEYEPA